MAKVFWTAVNTEKNHPASSPDPRDKAIIEWTWVPSKTQSAGHSFLMDSTGTADTKDPASSLLRSWFSWHANQPTLNSGTQTSPSWNRILILSISDSKTSTLVCGCQDVSPIEVWSDPNAFFLLEAQSSAHIPGQVDSSIPKWVSDSGWIIFHSNTQPRTLNDDRIRLGIRLHYTDWFIFREIRISAQLSIGNVSQNTHTGPVLLFKIPGLMSLNQGSGRVSKVPTEALLFKFSWRMNFLNHVWSKKTFSLGWACKVFTFKTLHAQTSENEFLE